MSQVTGDALYSRFLRGLELSPDRAAIRVGEGAEQVSLSYAETHRTALRWAGALPGPQAGPVGVLAADGPTAYVGILAALYSGATVVPLHPDWPAERTGRMLAEAGVGAVLTDEAGLAALARVLGDEPRPDLLLLIPGAGGQDVAGLRTLSLDGAEPLSGPRPVDPSDTAYVLFTSGSTGRPKGVPITHGNTAHYFEVLDRRYDFGPHDVFSQTFDLNFDCAMFDLFCAWGSGATLVRIPPHAYRDLPVFLAEQGVTVWFSTPSAIALVRRMGGLTKGSMPALRWSFFAGEALSCQDAADWLVAAPGGTVENLYGPTELTVTIAGYRYAPDSTPESAVNGAVPIGTVHEGHDHLLLGDDGVTSATEGELCVAGPQATPGYLRPGDDEGRFLEHDGRRYYRTGDRVRRTATGDLAYLGRSDNQVKVQGRRVELSEIDHALRTAPEVEDAVTVAAVVGDTTALVVFYTGNRLPPVELARRLRPVLPPGTIPRHFQHLPELPLNSNRKVDRLVLRARATELLRESNPA
ncbi:AMP-binding protein [Streptomyces sp. NPDC058155]|uniref:AMP-binding protein n=1 Tax=Streptomyces sp. NPDC058155 TaxID=3346359 RepID=UPI0036EE9DDC